MAETTQASLPTSVTRAYSPPSMMLQRADSVTSFIVPSLYRARQVNLPDLPERTETTPSITNAVNVFPCGDEAGRVYALQQKLAVPLNFVKSLQSSPSREANVSPAAAVAALE